MNNISRFICKLTFLSLSIITIFSSFIFSSSLNIETDYSIKGISYSNNDFDINTSTDALSYYSQRLQISLIGKFPQQSVEIGSKITATGVAGSTYAVSAVPYIKTDFTPYIENAYIKLIEIAGLPIDMTIGKQSLTYGQGLIICDNGAGFNAIRLIGNYQLQIPYSQIVMPIGCDIFTAKVKDNFKSASDLDLYGAVINFNIGGNLYEAGFFEERDFSGTKYYQGINEYNTTDIVKDYIDFRIERKEKISSFQFEIAKQSGYVIEKSSQTRIIFDGMGFVLSGELIGERTKIGKVSAHGLISYFTGDDNPLSFDNDKSFSPTFTKKFNGIEKIGYGDLFAATPGGAFLYVPDSYSGIDTLNVGMAFTPVYAVTFGIDYFYFAASKSLLPGAPAASGFERFYGAEFTLGQEMDLTAKYTHTKYTEIRFLYGRYTPPKFETFWPKNEPATRIELSVSAKF